MYCLMAIHLNHDVWVQLFAFSIDVLNVSCLPIHEFKIKVPNFSQIHFQVHSGIKLAWLKVIVVGEQFHRKLHRPINDINKRYRVIRKESIMKEPVLIPNLDVQSLRFKLKVRGLVNSVDDSLIQSRLISFNEPRHIRGMDNAKVSLRQVYNFVLTLLLDLDEEIAANKETNKRIDRFLGLVDDLDIGYLHPELPQ